MTRQPRWIKAVEIVAEERNERCVSAWWLSLADELSEQYWLSHSWNSFV